MSDVQTREPQSSGTTDVQLVEAMTALHARTEIKILEVGQAVDARLAVFERRAQMRDDELFRSIGRFQDEIRDDVSRMEGRMDRLEDRVDHLPSALLDNLPDEERAALAKGWIGDVLCDQIRPLADEMRAAAIDQRRQLNAQLQTFQARRTRDLALWGITIVTLVILVDLIFSIWGRS